MRFGVAGVLVMLALAGCQTDTPEALPPVGDALLAVQKTACEKRGGSMKFAGSYGGQVCFTTPRDAGKSCHKSTDCSTSCLARSQTCAPIEPLLGCQEILNEDGARLTQCIN